LIISGPLGNSRFGFLLRLVCSLIAGAKNDYTQDWKSNCSHFYLLNDRFPNIQIPSVFVNYPSSDSYTLKISKANNSRVEEVDFEKLVFGQNFTDHMLICKFKNGAWQEPEIKPYGPLSFTPAMHTLHYGQAIFEGQKAYYMNNGEIGIFRPEANAKRLNHSAR